MKIELVLRNPPPAGMRLDATYRLEPVIEGGDTLMGYTIWNADTGAFVMFVTDDEVHHERNDKRGRAVDRGRKAAL